MANSQAVATMKDAIPYDLHADILAYLHDQSVTGSAVANRLVTGIKDHQGRAGYYPVASMAAKSLTFRNTGGRWSSPDRLQQYRQVL